MMLSFAQHSQSDPEERPRTGESEHESRYGKLAESVLSLTDRCDDTSFEDNRVTLADGGKFVVEFGYDPNLVEEVKEIPGRKFNGLKKWWTVPASLEVIEPLLDFIIENDFGIDRTLVDEMYRVVTEHEQQMVASHADDADIEIEGLGGELRPFQKAGVAYALRSKRTFIADQMGLGKTVQALATIQAADAYPALIIVPASLKINWKREAEKWLPNKTATVVTSGKNSKHDPNADITIINYDILGKHYEELLARGFAAVILDESHYIKNHKAKRTKLCRDLAKGAKVRLLLSGTPLLSRPQELISQLEILDRLDELGGFWGFANRYCNAQRTRFGLDMSGAAHLDELNEKLRGSCYVRRTKDQVLTELPAKQHAVLPVALSNRWEYDRAEKELVKYLGEVAENDEGRITDAVEKWTEKTNANPDRARCVGYGRTFAWTQKPIPNAPNNWCGSKRSSSLPHRGKWMRYASGFKTFWIQVKNLFCSLITGRL